MEEERKEVIAKYNLTMAEITKMDSTREWSGSPKISYEEAYIQVQKEQKCSKENIEARNDFTSEMSSISAITRIANLSREDAEKMENEFFSQGTFSNELAEKIRNGLTSGLGVEANVIEILRNVHDGWVIDNSNNFQGFAKGKNGNPDKKRDKDYQFTDLLLMSYGADGATADLVFLKPILEGCGITLDMNKLEQTFTEMSENFLVEKGILNKETLLEYIQSGDYEPLNGLTTEARGLKLIDRVDLDKDRILITDLLKRPEIANHMTEQVVEKNAHLREVLQSKKFDNKNFVKFAGEGVETEKKLIKDLNKNTERVNDNHEFYKE